MVLVILAVCITLIVVGTIIYNSSCRFEDIAGVMAGIGAVFGLIALLCALLLAIKVSNLSVIDDKIAMYQEENTKIEAQIAAMVESYQKYETDIFTEVAPDDSAIVLVALYPELKSDALVQSQIDIYIQNNEKVKELRETQISASVYRWWLYFGGGN